MFSPINKTSYSLEKLNESAYQLTIDFAGQEGTLSQKQVTFIQESSVQEATVFDVLTKNGTCKSALLKSLFRKNDVCDVQSACLKLGSPSGPTVAVLDLKDPYTGYLPPSCDLIPNSEEQVCDFFP